ncbi:MAG: hypothetical protein GX221_06780 [Candidatus Riflebacteria bacterium]|nr:hypothetical protein [Candidatus Riflebacteria bacterium]
MKNLLNSKRGYGIIIVILFMTVMFVLFAVYFKMQSAHSFLYSKHVRRSVASNLAEGVLNCIIAELDANRTFATHWNYDAKDTYTFKSPVKSRETSLGPIPNFKIGGVKNGIYYGSSDYGTFKAKFAPCFGGFENPKTKTLSESSMYTKAEIAVKTEAGKTSKDEPVCIKLSAILERRFPSAEHALYDGEVLDIGALGPYNSSPNEIRRARLYGHHSIFFTSKGAGDHGTELFEIEKIETPGMIRVTSDTDVKFSDNTSTVLCPENDSLNITAFNSFEGYLIDGTHGAHSIKLNRIPKERLLNYVQTYKKSSGVYIDSSTLPESEYRNPYDPQTKYYDLDFGEYRLTSEGEKLGSDDPKCIKEKNGEKIVVYSKVPLRIWGSPDKSITIYSEKDIVIAGDYNQKHSTRQVYKDNRYLDYATRIYNGKYNHKVGSLIMTEGRIIIDYSDPSLFAKNEIKPYFLWKLAESMNPYSQKIAGEIKTALAPPDPSERTAIFGVEENIDATGKLIPRLGTIAFLYNFPEVDEGGSYNANMEDLIAFFTPGTPKSIFPIKNTQGREELIEIIKDACRTNGDLTLAEQDEIFNFAWQKALEDRKEAPDEKCAIMEIIPHLFKDAAKDHRDGLFIPEMTINSFLISSEKRSSIWRQGNNSNKAMDEIGNVGDKKYIKPPGFIILRIYGGYARIGRKEPSYFISGEHTTKTGVLRRIVWDNTNLTNQDYRPLEQPVTHNVLTISETLITEKEYEEFSGKE